MKTDEGSKRDKRIEREKLRNSFIIETVINECLRGALRYHIIPRFYLKSSLSAHGIGRFPIIPALLYLGISLQSN